MSQGFPLTVCPDAMLVIGQYAAEHDRLFSMNLSAPFLCSFFKEPMTKLLPYVDILFGNEEVGYLMLKEIIIEYLSGFIFTILNDCGGSIQWLRQNFFGD